jgi:nucleoside-diphosphate-sugar epimerase
MSILVTGSSSYIGKSLINYFENKKIDYIGIDLLKPYTKKCIKINIEDSKINSKIKKKIKTIIHLAAISTDQLSNNDPALSYKVNIFGSMNLIKFAKRNKIKNFIFASSEWVYGSFKNNEIKSINSKIEIEKLDSSYAKTKAIMEKIITSSEKLNYSILRFGIIYGNKISNFSAVESIVEQVKNRNIINIQSKKTSRSFIHVVDIVRAIICSLKLKGKYILDIQGPKPVNLEKLIKYTSNFINKRVKIIEKNKKNCSIKLIDSSLSNRILNFKPKISIEKGISEILNKK